VRTGEDRFVVTAMISWYGIPQWGAQPAGVDERWNLVAVSPASNRHSRGKLVLRIEPSSGKALRHPLAYRSATYPLAKTFSCKSTATRVRRDCSVPPRSCAASAPTYKVAELTTERIWNTVFRSAFIHDLLRQGASAWATLSEPGSPDPFACADGSLTFGLIWLDYLVNASLRW